MNTSNNIVNVQGKNPYQVGLALGRHIGLRLEHNINLYISERPDPQRLINLDVFRNQALPWLNQLPLRFQHEFTGLAEGAEISLQRIAEWAYFEAYINQGCSSFLCHIDDRVWLGHNNDTFVPQMWGYVTIRNIAGRIPTMNFGLEGDIWTTAGVNQSQLWLHIDHLPVSDTPRESRQCLPTYGFLVEALETCETIQDVERLLNQIDRDDGMLLFAVDGKTDTSAIFECSCATAIKCKFDTEWAVRTNHACVTSDAMGEPHNRPFSSWSRFRRLEHLLHQHYSSPTRTSNPQDLVCFLADDEVERRGERFATAYSTLACPHKKEVWFTFGGYPAASCGNWSRVSWPW